jgi:O-antigen/teichoic acid export membrane protein
LFAASAATFLLSILKKLFSDTLWYGVSTILGRVLNYALVPLYTATLPVAANGIITALFAYAAFINVLLTFGMETAYFRFTQGEASDQAKQAARGQTLILCLCVAFLGLLGLGMPMLEGYLKYPQTSVLVWVLAFVLCSDALTAIPMARLRVAGKARLFALYRLGTLGLNIGFNLLFILVVAPSPALAPLSKFLLADAQPVLWVFYANLLSNAPLLLLVRPAQFQLGLLRGAAARFMVRYAWPIVLMGLAGMGNQMLGILQLERLLPQNFYPGITNLEAVGIYGQCYKLSIFMALIVQAFRLGAEPYFFSMAGNATKEAGFALVMKWFVLACIGVLVLVSINLGWLAPLVLRRPEYLLALSVVPTLLVANLWLGVFYNLSVWFKLTDRTQWGSWFSLGGLAITLLLNTWLIPIYGFGGAAASTVICYFSMALFCYIVGQRYMPIPYAAIKLTAYVGIAYLGCALFDWLTAGFDNWAMNGMRLAYFLAYLLIIAYEAWPILKARRQRSTQKL